MALLDQFLSGFSVQNEFAPQDQQEALLANLFRQIQASQAAPAQQPTPAPAPAIGPPQLGEEQRFADLPKNLPNLFAPQMPTADYQPPRDLPVREEPKTAGTPYGPPSAPMPMSIGHILPDAPPPQPAQQQPPKAPAQRYEVPMQQRIGDFFTALGGGNVPDRAALAEQRNHTIDLLVRQGKLDPESARALSGADPNLRNQYYASAFTPKTPEVKEFEDPQTGIKVPHQYSPGKGWVPVQVGGGAPQGASAQTPMPGASRVSENLGAGAPGAAGLPGAPQRVNEKLLTTAQKALDKEFGKDYSDFVTGGFADAQKGLQQLRGVLGQLRSGKGGLTGTFEGLATANRAIGSVIAPTALDAKESVEEVVQRNLRAVLGAQFTQVEGDRLISRAYNPYLGEEENAARLDRLANSMEKALKAKAAAAQHFEQFGTLANYKGSVNFSMADIERDAGLDAPAPKGGQAAPQQGQSQPREGQTATNPQTGQQLTYRGGKWQ
jgi:hypothetical protein